MRTRLAACSSLATAFCTRQRDWRPRRRSSGEHVDAEQQTIIERGSTIYDEILFRVSRRRRSRNARAGRHCGRTDRCPLARRLTARIGHRDYVIRAILHGLTGPIDGRTYSQVMVPLGSNKDQWVADVASFVRNSFGNSATFVAPADVARVRAATANRTTQWTVSELEASLPRALVPDSSWKVTASHDAKPTPNSNAAGGFNMAVSAASALTYLGWTTGEPQLAACGCRSSSRPPCC